MPEPASAGVGTFIATGAAIPILTIAGIPLGLRVDELLAGFFGAIAAISLLNSVPSSGDTLRELIRTSVRRVGVAIGGAVTAGYLTPLVSVMSGIPYAAELSLSFAVGAGAQSILRSVIDRLRTQTGPQEGVQK